MTRITPRRLWNAMLLYGAIALFVAIALAAIVSWSVVFVTALMGHSAWLFGAIIGVLISALGAMHIHHKSQLETERERFRDFEDANTEFYS